MAMGKVWAVVPSAAQDDRLLRCLRALGDTPTCVVDTGLSVPPYPQSRPRTLWTGHNEHGNISAWWNHGILVAKEADPSVTHIAFVNDDAEVPPLWAETLMLAMENHGAAAGYSVQSTRLEYTHRYQPDNADRMTGWAFVLDIRKVPSFDESMKWWYSDNDAEWRACQAGGVLKVGLGDPVIHHHAGEATNANPELSAQAGQDRATFLAKWGSLPH